MGSRDFYPLYDKPGIGQESGWVFRDHDDEIEVDNHSLEISEILQLANGQNPEGDIVSELGKSYDPALIKRIIEDLRALEVLVDSRMSFEDFHRTTHNPTIYPSILTLAEALAYTKEDPYIPREGQVFDYEALKTKIGEISKERHSCRNFEQDRPVESKYLGACLDAAFSSEIRPIPSAGALYPLRAYMIVREGCSDIPSGYYHYNHEDQTLVMYNDEVDIPKLRHIFNSETLAFNAPILFVIVADLERQPKKYQNRGYRYTILEAGHAAQNIEMAATELGLGSLEFGAFQDKTLGEELELPKEKALICIGLGYESKTSETAIPTYVLAEKLEKLVGENKPVEWVSIDILSEGMGMMDFFHATSKYRLADETFTDDSACYASGTARSVEVARIKAIAEGYERHIAGEVRWDISAPAATLDEEWLHPYKVLPYSEEQLTKKSRLEPFDENMTMQWIKGFRKNGSGVYIPIDTVFYPISEKRIGRKKVADANSSGMATYTDYNEAVKRATLELVERDAIMRMWLNKKSPNIIDTKVLPFHYQRRGEFWNQRGHVAEVLDLSENSIAITTVIIRSPNGEYPFFVAGASASTDSFEDALDKAYQEAELIFASAVNIEQLPDKLSPEEVQSPGEHGRFYYYDHFKEEIEWLWAGPREYELPEVDINMDIIDKYDPIIVKLTEDTAPLKVVRVLCPDLVPVSFGLGNEFYSHPKVGFSKYEPKAPHFFA